MAANLDLPPSYITIQGPKTTLTIDDVEEAESKSDETKGDREELLFNDSFEDKTTRLIFIQKVLTIKLLQVLGILVFMGIFAVGFGYSYRTWMCFKAIRLHLIVTSTLAYLLTLILLICCNKARRRNPYKYIFLVAYPLSMAFFISSETMYWDAMDKVGMVWSYHCVAVFAVLLYSVFVQQTKFDFVTLHGIYISIGVQAVLYALTAPFLFVNPFCVLYATIFVILEHVYLLFALRVMTTNDYKRPMTPDDYVDAAINLHIDYIYIIINYLVPKIRTAFAKCANK